jgi:hypothetical protein
VIKLNRVDFPDPLGPTNATIDPGATFKLKFSYRLPKISPSFM